MSSLPVFDARFVRALPADPSTENRSRQVTGAAYSFVEPTAVKAPRLLAHSPSVAALLGLDDAVVRSDDFARVFGGNGLWPGMKPYAACYGGHQFGSWAGQLGDGRAIVLGELLTREHGRQELQLKGAGPTPYSRRGDGRAVLRSSLREFVCSEAMHALGVPTTRALSLVATGEDVVRDLLYDGNPRPEPGAIVCRVAPTFLRFGNFELLAAREDHTLLRQLVDDTVSTHFPELGAPGPDATAAFFAEVCRRTAVLMAHWMRVGFVHGVMNTDNMSVLGLTIDYGPYGWLDDFDPDWTPNTTDAQSRRYRYRNQPAVALWNLERLAVALAPLLPTEQPLVDGLQTFERTFELEYTRALAGKLGLTQLEDQDDRTLAQDVLRLLASVETDMTNFFRALSAALRTEDAAPLEQAFYEPAAVPADHRAALTAWLERWRTRARREGTVDELTARLHAANPKYVLRNYLAQEAIDAAEQGELSLLHELFEVLQRPYVEQPGKERFARPRPDWAKDKPGCSALSCSS